MQTRTGSGRARLFFTLLVAFALVVVSAGYLLYTRAIESSETDFADDLISLSRLAALQVDPEAHEQLTNKSQQDSALYSRQLVPLKRALDSATGVRFIYTLRLIGSKTYFVLDPTPAGDADGDGVDDKSYLLDEFREVTPIEANVFRTGVAELEATPSTDAWGTFITAYAPIIDRKGHVVAILGVDREFSGVERELSGIRRTAAIGGILAFVLAAAFAWLLSGMMARGCSSVGAGDPRSTTRAQSGFLRSTLVEMGVLAGVATVLAVGLSGQIQQMATDTEIADLLERTEGVIGIEQRAVALLRSKESSPSEWESLADTARVQGLSQTAAFCLARSSSSGSSASTGDLNAMLEDATSSDVHETMGALSKATQRQATNRLVVEVVFAISSILSLLTMVLMRASARQQRQILALEETRRKSELKFEQLVEGLPIGLFAFRNGECTYSNAAWDSQTERGESESRTNAFLRAIHEADRSTAIATLREAEDLGSAGSCQVRIVRQGGDVRYYDLISVPSYDMSGRLDQVLAFFVNRTKVVRAQEQLQESNQMLERNVRLLNKALGQLEASIPAMLQTLVMAVEAKDRYTAGHSNRVKEYSLRIGREIGLSESELKVLEMGTLIHDIGKIGVPDAILGKRSKLTDDEFRIMATHPILGHKIIEGMEMCRHSAPIVLHHHEKLDGSGYPAGLKGDEIPLLVRISTVADTFDAITSTRSYRKGMGIEYGLNELENEAKAGKLDSEIVRVFTEIVKRDGIIPDRVEKAA